MVRKDDQRMFKIIFRHIVQNVAQNVWGGAAAGVRTRCARIGSLLFIVCCVVLLLVLFRLCVCVLFVVCCAAQIGSWMVPTVDCDTGVCGKTHTPPEKMTHWNRSMRSTESEAGEQFLPWDSRAKAFTIWGRVKTITATITITNTSYDYYYYYY